MSVPAGAGMGEFFEVRILSARPHPDNFFLRLVSAEPLLHRIQDTLHSVIGLAQHPHHNSLAFHHQVPQVGCFVAVKWQDQFFRAQVEEVLDTDVIATLFDIGQEEVIENEDLYVMPYSLVSQPPPLSLRCVLRGWADISTEPDVGLRRRRRAEEAFVEWSRTRGIVLAKFFPYCKTSARDPDYEVELVSATSLLQHLTEAFDVSFYPENSINRGSVIDAEEAQLVITSDLAKEECPADPPVGTAVVAEQDEMSDEVNSVHSADDSSTDRVREWLDGKKENLAQQQQEQQQQQPGRPASPDFIVWEKDVPRMTIDLPSDARIVLSSQSVSPDEFYLQILENASLSLYIQLLEEMQIYFDQKEQTGVDLELLTPGVMLGVKDPSPVDAENTEWLRAEFLGHRDGQLEIFLVDQGDRHADVPCKHAHLLPGKFATVPILAVKCKLLGLQPPASTGVYSEEASQLMKQKSDVRTAKFIAKNNGCILVDLVVLDDTGEDVMLTDLLIERGLAVDSMAAGGKMDATSASVEEVEQLKDQPMVMDKEWNPMKEEFQSYVNTYDAPLDNLHMLKDEDEEQQQRICRFFRETGHCIRGDACQFLHVFTGKGDPQYPRATTLKVAHHEIALPRAGAVVPVDVSDINTPDSFFVRMPWGNFDMTETDENKIRAYEERLLREESLESLEAAMLDFYSARTHSHRLFTFCPGEVVAAQCPVTNKWHRARIVQTHDDTGHISVQFVDFGNIGILTEWNIRQLEERFLSLPFQAFEACLAEVDPVSDDGKWSKEAREMLFQLTNRKCLVANFLEMDGVKVTLSLSFFDEPEKDLAQSLINAGFAKRRVATGKIPSVRIPG